MEKIIILTGNTACGKTSASICLAKKLNGEIISADSMQVYRRMDIGTAKVTPEEADGIKHYLVDEFDPDYDYSAAVFCKYARKYISEIASKGKVPIIVGGTGFYINALLYGAEFSEEKADKCRDELYKSYNEKGAGYIYDMLLECDPKAAESIHKNNIKRVIRAIEFYRTTGKRISEHNAEEKKKKAVYDHSLFIFSDERDKLYARINSRVDKMIEDGLIDEVKALIDSGYSRNLTSMQGIGYKETTKYIYGEISLEDAVELIKRNTRRFAKRQITWFKNQTDGIWLNASDYTTPEDIADMIISHKDEKFSSLRRISSESAENIPKIL